MSDYEESEPDDLIEVPPGAVGGTLKVLVSVVPASVSAGPVSTFASLKWPSNLTLKQAIESAMKTYPPLLDLGDKIHAGIGRIVVQWAYAEWMLQDVLNVLHGWDRKDGRELDKYPPFNTVRNEVKVLMPKRGVIWDEVRWADFAHRTTNCDKARNLVSHGVWFKDEEGRICVQEISGDWRPPGAEKNQVVSKKLYPGTVFPDENWFNERMKEIREATDLIVGLHSEASAAMTK